MKCKNCRGTGERHTINWETGKVHIVQGEKCPVCGGKGDIEQTNEEWFCQLSTEEKAEVIFDIVDFCLNYETYHDKNKYRDLMGTTEDIERWLKQPHREE